MATPSYKRQYRAVISAKATLEGFGYVVMRSSITNGIFDLVGLNKDCVILVKVKTCPAGKVPMYPGTKDRIKKVKVPKTCKRELWVREKRKGWHYFPV